MKKKIIAALLALTLSAGVLTACGGSKTDSADTAATESAASEEAASEAKTETAGEASTESEESFLSVNIAEKYADKEDAFLSNIKAADYVDVSALDYEGMTVEVTPAEEITEEYIDELIESERQSNTSNQEITDRTEVQSGDVANIDYVGKIDGEEFSGGSATGYDLTIGSGTFIDGFEDQLIGAKVGDTVTVNVTFPDDYSSADLAGKEAEFTVTVNSISEQVVPELTDEYVAGLNVTDNDGNAITTVDGYREYALKYMTEAAEETYQTNVESAIAEYLVANVELKKDAPQNLIDRMRDYYHQAWEVRAQAYGTDLATLMNYYGYDKAGYTKLFDEWGESRAKLMIILQAIADEEGLVTDEGMQSFKDTEVSDYGYTSVEEFSEALNTSDIDLQEEYVRKQAIEFLKERVTITQKAETSTAADTASEASTASAAE